MPRHFTHLTASGGANWRIGGNSSRTTNECALAELGNGTVVMNSRNYVGARSGGLPGGATHTVHRGISWSHDGGGSFSAAYSTQMPAAAPCDPILPLP